MLPAAGGTERGNYQILLERHLCFTMTRATTEVALFPLEHFHNDTDFSLARNRQNAYVQVFLFFCDMNVLYTNANSFGSSFIGSHLQVT